MQNPYSDSRILFGKSDEEIGSILAGIDIDVGEIMYIYPNTPELQKYNRQYNTRVVTADEYLNAIKEAATLNVK